MKGLLSLCAMSVIAAMPASAQSDATDADTVAGAATFKTYCAVCHGKEGRGDGPLADSLRYVPADLTRIAKRNRSRFDADKVRQIIDGRRQVRGHGGTDMPVWGDALLRATEGYDAENVQTQIAQLVRFIESLQSPPPTR